MLDADERAIDPAARRSARGGVRVPRPAPGPSRPGPRGRPRGPGRSSRHSSAACASRRIGPICLASWSVDASSRMSSSTTGPPNGSGSGRSLPRRTRNQRQAVREAVGDRDVGELAAELVEGDMADHRDVRRGRADRSLGHDPQVAAVPGVAEDGRQRVPLAAHDPEHAGELRLDDQQALVGLALVDDDRAGSRRSCPSP